MKRTKVANIVNQKSREEIQQIFENFGFAVYESEPLKKIRTALIENVMDGTIPFDDIQ